MAGSSRRKSLAGRIFWVLFLFSLAVAVAATVAATALSFSVYERDAEQILLAQASSYAELIEDKRSEDAMAASLAELPFVETRCTLIAADGTVVFDNYADPASMDNHAQREEVSAAKESGKVAVMRRSETMGSDTLYAAALVRDGIVVRLAETRTSLASFLGGLSWQLAATLVIIFLMSLLVAHGLTVLITRPLRKLDLSRPLDNDAYQELQPLLQRVDAQRSELEEQNRELEQAVALRREFTGNVSHEMKSPLQVIGGYAELMESGMVAPEDVPRFAGLIRSESQAMRELIDDVLSLSRLDERAEGSRVPIDLEGLCRRSAQRLEAAASERGVSVRLLLRRDIGVLGDPAMIEQMVYNLVSNAIKYNREGGLVLLQLESDAGSALISVEDEGPGIPEELRERVFERFFRIDASRSRDTGGTGLGLAIVKHVAESQGGSVTVGKSHLGGAAFTVRLPLLRHP
ncbi:MAG: ATP-binding protein [Coriobacteriaceae bacterium]|nr:ATP-binding protein [Coriobacteriaceae bacterium]